MPPAWAHLVVGEASALLIDTGYGIGDLKAITEQIVGNKPYTVVNTHSHADHSMGNYQFGSVYIHQHEAPLLQEQMNESFLQSFFPRGNWLTAEEKPVSFAPYEIRPCTSGKIFHLGLGHDIELISVPGHSPGGAALLDHKNRILFSGDAVMLYLSSIGRKSPCFGEYATLEACTAALEKLCTRTEELDYVFPGHNALMLPKSIVFDTYAACKAMLEEPDGNEYTLERFGTENKVKVSGDASILVYPQVDGGRI